MKSTMKHPFYLLCAGLLYFVNAHEAGITLCIVAFAEAVEDIMIERSTRDAG